MQTIKIQKRKLAQRAKLQKELIAIQADELWRQKKDAELQRELVELYSDKADHQLNEINNLKKKVVLLEAVVRRHNEMAIYLRQTSDLLGKIAIFFENDAAAVHSFINETLA